MENPLQPLNPVKHLALHVGKLADNGTTVWNHSRFLYAADSTILSADRAVRTPSSWTITDQLNPNVDRPTGQWAIYSTTPLVITGHKLPAGVRLAGSNYTTPLSWKLDTPLFTMTASRAGLVRVEATALMLRLAGQQQGKVGWRFYLQVERVQPVEHQTNTVEETLNHAHAASNTVWSRTPRSQATLHIVKWDEASGRKDGDRNSPQEALELKPGAHPLLAFTITNTSSVDPVTHVGPLFRAKDLKLDDQTIVGSGIATRFAYPKNWQTLVLKPGESVTVHATVEGIMGIHTDRARVTGVPLIPCPAQDTTPFNKTSKHKTIVNPATKTANTPGKTGKAATANAATAGGPANGAANSETAGLCQTAPVTSNTDDWNARIHLELPHTGAASMPIAAVMILLCGLAATVAAGAARQRVPRVVARHKQH